MLFLDGLLIGFCMVVFIGPVFFLLLSVSLEKGVLAGSLVALGIIVSDILCVFLCFIKLFNFINSSSFQFWIALIGGFLLIFTGLKYFLKPILYIQDNNPLNSKTLIACFASGFLVNFINPFVFFVWIGVISYLRSKKFGEGNSILYLSGAILGILTTDLIKVLLAKQLKQLLNPGRFAILYKFAGFTLICFGLRLLYLLI